MPRGSLLLALLAASCGERAVSFGLPPLDGARSAIFALHAPGFFQARAVDLTEGAPLSVSFEVELEPDEGGEIEALGFSRTLSDLGLSAGKIDSVPGGKLLPAEDELFILSFKGEEGGWVEGEERSPEVDDLRLPFETDCAVLEVVDSFILESSEDHAFTISLGAESAIVAQTDGAIYVIQPSGPRRVTDIRLPLPLTDAVRLADGTLLFSGTLGRIFTGRITTSTSSSPIRIEGQLLTTIPSQDLIFRIAAGDEDGALEIFAVTQMGGFHRYDGSSWEELHQFGVTVTSATEVVRPRPGLAYASTDEKAEVVRYRDGRVDPASPPDLMNGIPGMRHLEQIGLVASRSEGGLYLLRDLMDWELLEGSPIALNVYSFHWLENSFLFAGTVGLVSEYRIADGYCPAVTLGAGAIREMTPFGDGFLFGEDKPLSRDKVQATIVRFVR